MLTNWKSIDRSPLWIEGNGAACVLICDKILN